MVADANATNAADVGRADEVVLVAHVADSVGNDSLGGVGAPDADGDVADVGYGENVLFGDGCPVADDADVFDADGELARETNLLASGALGAGGDDAGDGHGDDDYDVADFDRHFQDSLLMGTIDVALHS